MRRQSQLQAPRAGSGGAWDHIHLVRSGSVTVRTPVGFRLLDVHLADGPAWFRIGDASPYELAAASFVLAPSGAPRRLAVRSAVPFLRARLHPAALPLLSPAMLAGVVVSRDAALRDAAEGVAERLRSGEAMSGRAAQALFDALCATLAGGPDAAPQVIEGGGCVAKALDFILRHLDSPMTTDAVAAAAGAPSRSLARRFRLTTGVTIREYVLRRRIAQAESLLKKGGGSIADVAYAVGFGSQSHMTTQFRRRLGCTPGELARR